MSSPSRDFANGQIHAANGGELPYGTTNSHFFAGAAAERGRLDAAERRKRLSSEAGSGSSRASSDSGAGDGFFWALFFLGVVAAAGIICASSAPNPAPSAPAQARVYIDRDPFSDANLGEPIPSYWPVMRFKKNRVKVATLNVREFGNMLAPIKDQLRRGVLVYTTVHTNSQWAMIYYTNKEGHRRYGAVLNTAIALE